MVHTVPSSVRRTMELADLKKRLDALRDEPFIGCWADRDDLAGRPSR